MGKLSTIPDSCLCDPLTNYFFICLLGLMQREAHSTSTALQRIQNTVIRSSLT